MLHSTTHARYSWISTCIHPIDRYICSLTKQELNVALVSNFTVAVNTSFAPYTFCNQGSCAGWQSPRVGRRVNWRYVRKR